MKMCVKSFRSNIIVPSVFIVYAP